MAPGTRKAHGGFWLPCDRNQPVLVILTESAVDAISARSLRVEGTRENGAIVASTAGTATSIPPWIEDWKPKRTSVPTTPTAPVTVPHTVSPSTIQE